MISALSYSHLLILTVAGTFPKFVHRFVRLSWEKDTYKNHAFHLPFLTILLKSYSMTILGTALVTGASRGIGRGIACRLSRDGFTVVTNDLPSKKSQLEEVQAHITKQGGKALTFLADVSVENEVTQMIESVVEQTGGLDVVRDILLIFSHPYLTWKFLDGR